MITTVVIMIITYIVGTYIYKVGNSSKNEEE